MKIGVVGYKGMLGKQVARAVTDAGHEVVHIRMDYAVPNNEPDAIINCAGRIPEKKRTVLEMVQANALLPHLLAANFPDTRLVHVSTDCVFSGEYQHLYQYLESSSPSPVDMYGRTKLAGEITYGLAVTVRTSFVWLDHGLLRWLIDSLNAGKIIQGYRNCLWSGSTATVVARALVKLATEDRGRMGTVHLSTMAPINKLALLKLLADELSLPDRIQVGEHWPSINRALHPSSGLELPPMFSDEVIGELKREYDHWRRYSSRAEAGTPDMASGGANFGTPTNAAAELSHASVGHGGLSS